MVRLPSVLTAALGLALAAGGGALAQETSGDTGAGQPAAPAGQPETPAGKPAAPASPTPGDEQKPAKPTIQMSLPTIEYRIDKLGRPDDKNPYSLGGGYDLGYHPPDTGTGCKVKPAGGWFQPVQGVFQDDSAFPKVTYDYMHGAKPNPVINEVALGQYTADLPMVAARDTVVMGVQRYRSKGAVQNGFTWYTIVFKGIGNCGVDADVKFRLKLTDINGTHVIWTSPVVARAPIHGSPGTMDEPFQVLVPAYDGLPPKEVGAFKIPGPGPYTLEAELLDAKDDSPTGLKLTVSGPVQSISGPVVEFIPLSLSGQPAAADASAFKAFVDQVADASNRILPDYFPLSPYDLPTYGHAVLDLSTLDPHESDALHNRWDWEASAADRLGAAGVLSGASRVVAIVRNGAQGAGDYGKIGSDKSGAMTSTTKAIFVAAGPGGDPDHPFQPAAPSGPPSANANSTLVETIGHELNHSEPDHLWSSDSDARHNMIRDCGRSDHNTYDLTAFGERIDFGGVESRRQFENGDFSMMGPVSYSGLWITQCAYAHLMYSFGHGVDPKVLFVRAVVSNRDKVMRARFMPAYDQTGEVDTAEGPAPDWAIVARWPDGTAKTYPIDPHWRSEEDYARDTVSILAHIPDPEGAAVLEVIYKGKVLASRDLAAQPPSLSVDAKGGAAARGQVVHLSWTAAAAGGGPVLSSVFYSNNKGRWYVDTLFEGHASEADVALDPHAKDHVIKIVVTDGGRSSERRTAFTTP